jgi:thiamine biosynthesis lipoprotein
MPTLDVKSATQEWSIWHTTARLVVTDPTAASAARQVVDGVLAAVDAACNRFRADSELRRLELAGGRPVVLSPLLAEMVDTALAAAELTGGAVDPTMGMALVSLGYDRDLTQIADAATRIADAQVSGARAADARIADASVSGGSVSDGSVSDDGVSGAPVASGVVPMPVVVQRAPGWQRIRLVGREVTVPVGVRLDLGAIGMAFAADLCATLVASSCGTGVLVSLGGDLATAGNAPVGGWSVRVSDGPDEPACTIRLSAGMAMATSSTISRRWRQGGRLLHQVLDPRTCQPTPAVWRTVSVAAPSCVAANTQTVAALVRGAAAPGMLRELRVPARLVAADGTVRTLGGWPTER